MSAQKFHAELSGSTAHRWMRCAGSPALCARYENRSSAAASEGTKAHALGEQILRYHYKSKEGPAGLRARFRAGTSFKWKDHDAELSGDVEQEMLDHVMVYVEHVLATSGGANHFELHVDLRPVTKLDTWGTTDRVHLSDDAKTLTVTDFKYGFTPVHVEDEHGPNPQLLYYAVGAMLKFWNSYVGDEVVILEIVQPRCTEVDPIQRIELEAATVMAWGTETLWRAAHAVGPNAPLVPGEWCRFCPALADCPAVHMEAQGLAASDFSELSDARRPEVPDDPHRLAKVLRAAPMIDAWLRACEEAAHAELSAGREVPGFKLVAKRSNRQWPTDDPKKLARALNLELPRACHVKPDILLTEPKLLSPAQLEKSLGRGYGDAINAVAEKPDNGTTVAAESDRRPAVAALTGFEELL